MSPSIIGTAENSNVLVGIAANMKFIFLERTFFTVISEMDSFRHQSCRRCFPQNRKTKTADISLQGDGRKRYRLEF